VEREKAAVAAAAVKKNGDREKRSNGDRGEKSGSSSDSLKFEVGCQKKKVINPQFEIIKSGTGSGKIASTSSAIKEKGTSVKIDMSG
jgi:hypothetical protein